MEDAAEAGADDAEPKKQYLLDRIATSDGFKDAKAHKEEDAPAAAAAADAKATEEASSGEDASPPKRRRPLLVDNLEPLARHALKYGELVVSKGSVLDAHVGALVNAANEGCQGGGGVDGAITRTGGDLLAEKREALPCLEGSDWRRCNTGDAVVTSGGPFGSLRCECVIHAVGPNYHSLPDGEGDELERGDALLRSAYMSSMARAKEEQCKTVAFSLLSAGIFRGRQSLDTILAISVGAVADGAYEGLERVPVWKSTFNGAFVLNHRVVSTRHPTHWLISTQARPPRGLHAGRAAQAQGGGGGAVRGARARDGGGHRGSGKVGRASSREDVPGNMFNFFRPLRSLKARTAQNPVCGRRHRPAKKTAKRGQKAGFQRPPGSTRPVRCARLTRGAL